MQPTAESYLCQFKTIPIEAWVLIIQLCRPCLSPMAKDLDHPRCAEDPSAKWRCYRCSKGQKFREPVPLDCIDVVHVFIQALDRYDNPQPGESSTRLRSCPSDNVTQASSGDICKKGGRARARLEPSGASAVPHYDPHPMALSWDVSQRATLPPGGRDQTPTRRFARWPSTPGRGIPNPNARTQPGTRGARNCDSSPVNTIFDYNELKAKFPWAQLDLSGGTERHMLPHQIVARRYQIFIIIHVATHPLFDRPVIIERRMCLYRASKTHRTQDSRIISRY
ncbi:hypothetical protein N656DRAFT_831873 [Canariomyces notabilis]|uniref:Uncharacterized protein n=1 Tax=Canariomyces notabilis TaxID=2074819 RepID=A0AAN6T9V3_9PEZI|nr:hypothetical protein N656DRAFT_831873 [Canariomyces arenarius]